MGIPAIHSVQIRQLHPSPDSRKLPPYDTISGMETEAQKFVSSKQQHENTVFLRLQGFPTLTTGLSCPTTPVLILPHQYQPCLPPVPALPSCWHSWNSLGCVHLFALAEAALSSGLASPHSSPAEHLASFKTQLCVQQLLELDLTPGLLPLPSQSHLLSVQPSSALDL